MGRSSDYGRVRINLVTAELDAALADERSKMKERELLALAEAGNAAAFDAEMACADSRKAARAAQEAADSISDSIEGAAAFKADVASQMSSLDARRAAVQTQIGSWYELAEDAVGAQGALSFGAGVDFGLPEGEFVAKWGAAIDRLEWLHLMGQFHEGLRYTRKEVPKWQIPSIPGSFPRSSSARLCSSTTMANQ